MDSNHSTTLLICNQQVLFHSHFHVLDALALDNVIQRQIEYRYWNEELPICAGLNLTKPRGIEELIIGNGLYNDNCDDISRMKVDLSELKKLKRNEIGNECFTNVREFVVDGLESLERINIGRGCFKIHDKTLYTANTFKSIDISAFESFPRSNVNSFLPVVRGRGFMGYSYTNMKIKDRPLTIGDERDDGVCRITNCPNLRQLILGYKSFEDFKSFEISNLNSIQSIIFGKGCFEYADFSLKGEWKEMNEMWFEWMKLMF